MFERYTECARRVIFYARYEASQYGSPYIETEHLLLGLLREDFATVDSLIPGAIVAERIRRKIESEIPARERISTSTEIPLTKDSKRILNLSAEEAEQCGHRHIGTEHVLLGLLRVEEGLAYKILNESKPDVVKIRERVRKLPSHPPQNIGSAISGWNLKSSVGRFEGLEAFLGCLRSGNWQELSAWFAEQSLFVNAEGKVWTGRKEISDNLQALLSPFATKKATHHLEAEFNNYPALWMGLLLWRHIHLTANADPCFARMSLVFSVEKGEWRISAMHLTATDELVAKGKTAAN
jgi:Clp amino terminal domain, pathogenicity island component/SnoaL-like domain